MEGLIRDHCSDEGLLPWTIRCFFCDDTISYSSSIDHFKNDCQDLNWIQGAHTGTEDLLNSSIRDDGDVTVKLNGFDNACIILQDAIVMLKRIEGRDEWKVAVFGGDSPVQLKYAEDITDTIIKYVLLDIQPNRSFKEFDVYSLLIFKGVLRVVQGVEEDTDSIDTTHFFSKLAQDMKDREEANLLHEDLTPSDET
jgi:hypothetical protein